MKRKELIQKLMENGFSEKTLVSFNDKQLATLGSKILSEVQTLTKTTDVYNSKDPNDIAKLNAALKNPEALKNKEVEVKETVKKKKFVSTEGEMSEEESVEEVKKKAKKKPSIYDKALKDLGGEEGVIKYLEKDMKGDKKKEVKEEKPSAGLSKEKKSEVVKKAKKGEDIGKKGKGFEKLADKAAKKYGSKEKGEKVAAAAMWKNVKKENKQLNEWVDSLVEKRYHPVATKNELMEAIKTKISTMEATVIPMPAKAKKGHNGVPEFMTYDAIAGEDTKPAQPATTPKTKPAEPRKDPRKAPFKKPDNNPRVKPNPKAEKLQNAAE